jgi:hypothetical protein
MNRMYWITAFLGAGFLGWAHCHTDEIPIVFGFVIITGALLGALWPRRAVLSWAFVGAPIPIVELLVHYSLLQAPYAATPLKDLPVITLIVLTVAAIGVAIGAAVRKMTGIVTIP